MTDPAPTPKRLKYTAPVRRGFFAILHALEEDTDYAADDDKSPHLRCLPPRNRRDALAAIAWMKQEMAAEYAKTAAGAADETPAAANAPETPANDA